MLLKNKNCDDITNVFLKFLVGFFLCFEAKASGREEVSLLVLSLRGILPTNFTSPSPAATDESIAAFHRPTLLFDDGIYNIFLLPFFPVIPHSVAKLSDPWKSHPSVCFVNICPSRDYIHASPFFLPFPVVRAAGWVGRRLLDQ